MVISFRVVIYVLSLNFMLSIGSQSVAMPFEMQAETLHQHEDVTKPSKTDLFYFLREQKKLPWLSPYLLLCHYY